ncbi:hypothetical protein F0L74_20450 [Chitinophaga agrisoli]|uniref:Uncharacterized protein n=1 Tax=Chitinophaga agrisoli TaxID=2607653 RepID=A0A5B2VK37_9BACT|nr:hypothetical protein [Chitinophaga agrisoli]KAA2238597.1 hypothetical protein F0L74_20450 [Chitinophaga agrisoli]
MKLADISIRTPNKFLLQFNEGGAIWSMTALYLSCLGKYEAGSFKKVTIEISDNADRENQMEEMLNVIKISRVFDFSLYYDGNKFERKKMILDVLQQGLLYIENSKKWDENALKAAYECCLTKKLEHTWIRENKYILSPGRDHYGGVYCN